MRREILDKDISTLNLQKDVTAKLSDNGINSIYSVCNYSRLELADLNFSNDQINKIIVNLELLGLDLKKNHAKKNTLLK